MATILQNNLFTNFLYPFLLIFFLVFAILEKTKILGDDKKQLNAMVSLVIGLIFVGFIFPKFMVENMILFMTVGLIIIFVTLMLWGFITGEGKRGFTFDDGKKINTFFVFILIIAIISGIIWASGLGSGFINGLSILFGFLFNSSWSKTLWGNVLIVGIIALAIVIVLDVKFKTNSWIKAK